MTQLSHFKCKTNLRILLLRVDETGLLLVESELYQSLLNRFRYGLRLGVNVQLFVDVFDVVANSFGTDEELIADFLTVQAENKLLKNFLFPDRERIIFLA